jgi:hypothetical protein
MILLEVTLSSVLGSRHFIERAVRLLTAMM